MTKKTYASIHDFLNDTSFQNWAQNNQLSDVAFWDSWIENNPSKKHLAFEARDILLGINFIKKDVSSSHVNKEWNKLETILKEKQKPSVTKSLIDTFTIKHVIAACFLIGLTLFYYNNYSNSFVSFNTDFGEVLHLKLKDGTYVTLNSNSSLKYNKNDVREVWLAGEAYFNVSETENNNLKFEVHTEDLTVQVYGTEFNVNTHRKKTEVFLEKGNIWLALNNGNSKRMSPGNYIEYSSIQKRIVMDKDIVYSKDKIAWKNGKLVFDNFTLEKALLKITDTYGVTFVYDNPELKKTPITGTVPTTNLEICLNAIKKSANITLKKENDKLVVCKN
ncbi:FecR family protein [Tenacibaculum sp. SG-28]|uniref:FecR family protein n=1 Tax=Tenacibaculum sp. SG-28 TaxID=754426 RepID=UPI000CF3A1D7|nr:FecR family protein [Tenacibaculum sp. SG-28]PQJ23126.1 hypothetical protein BSU00_02475 [Tenacibaculum sp. SG-28]